VDYALRPDLAYRSSAEARATFIRRTYAHLAGAVLAFTLLELVVFQTGVAERFVESMFSGGNVGILVMLVAFVGAGWLAQYWARANMPLHMQYLGLGLYVVVEAVIFIPLLYVATKIGDPKILPNAALLTLGLFFGLTAVTFVSGKDFSFLGPIICIGCFIAMAVVLAAILFGFTLGLVYSAAMIILAAAAILYSTSNVMHHYRTDQYVGAALDLFAAVALLFYYILRILIQARER
jgi:FtsH-binding integral membrane protein